MSSRAERLLVATNIAVLACAFAFLALSPNSVLRRAVVRLLEERRVAAAIHEEWPKLATGGVEYVSTSPANTSDTIVVFSDYECPFCRDLHVQLDSLSLIGSLPNIRYRQFPMPYHPQAVPAATLAVCAHLSGSFDRVHRSLMETAEWQQGGALTAMIDLPEQVRTEIRSCLGSGSADSALQDDARVAAKLGVQATPTIVLPYELHVGLLTEEHVARLVIRSRSGTTR